MKNLKPGLLISLTAFVALNLSPPVDASNSEIDTNEKTSPKVTTNVKHEQQAQLVQDDTKPNCLPQTKVIPLHQMPVERKLNEHNTSMTEPVKPNQLPSVKAKVTTNAAKGESKSLRDISAEKPQQECANYETVKVVPIGRLPVENVINKQKKEQKDKRNN